MLKKYISKFTIEILPSVFATVVGAYIVNYYIVPKAKGDLPSAAMTAPDIKAPDIKAPDGQAADAKPADIKPAEAAADTAAAPEPIRKISIDRTEKTEPAKPPESKSAESRRHAPAREKAVAKVEPKVEPKLEPKTEPKAEAKVEPKLEPVTAPAPTPVVASVGSSASAIDERRDANDLARAAIERLSRESKDAKVQEFKATEPARVPERTASVQAQPAPLPPPVQQAQPMQQLPPPIVVTSPNFDQQQQGEQRSARGPRPPGDIPVPLAVDLQTNGPDRGSRTNVAEDVLSAAKSMFDKVIPKQFER